MPMNPRATNLALNDANFREIVDNVLMSRQELMNKFFDPRRDIDKECGYPTSITPQHYRKLYDRDPVAARVVELMAEESWKTCPTVYEDENSDTVTAFEEAWDELQMSLRGTSWFSEEEGSPVWDSLMRADTLSGIGSFGCILLGIDDGKELREPVEGVGNDGKADGSETAKCKLLFLRSFDESLIQITKYETDARNPRFGMPTEYSITLNDPEIQSQGGIGLQTATQTVHWHRVIHIADNRGSSEIFGVPRQQPVYNRLMDLMKLYGGSAEMYWRGAFPGLSIETHPQLGGDVEIDPAALKQQMTSYMNGLQRYLQLMGMTAKTLAPQVVDPTPQIKVHINAICIKLGCPERVFMGSERGELASSQDSDTWEDRLKKRRRGYLTPKVIVPFVDRLIAMRVLPKPADGYRIEWPDARMETKLEKADVGLKTTQAVAAYVAGNVEALIPPMDYLTRVLGMEEEDAQAILDNADVAAEDPEEERYTPDPILEQEKQQELQAEQFDKKIEADKEIKGQLAKKGIQPVEKGPPIENYDPSQPRGYDGKWTSGGGGGAGGLAGFPKSIADLEFVSRLGGSTGAKLVKDPATGKKYVMKEGNSSGHLLNEHAADEIYRAAGVAVPNAKLYNANWKGEEYTGAPSEKPVKLAEYIEGKTLGQLNAKEFEAAKKELQKDFALDAMLANWDVVGKNMDNVLVDKAGKVYRIDNGGALTYRAQGALKGAAFDSSVSEIESMRKSINNPSSVKVFGDMTDADVVKSIDKATKTNFSFQPGTDPLVHNKLIDRKSALHNHKKGLELKRQLVKEQKQTTPMPVAQPKATLVAPGKALADQVGGYAKYNETHKAKIAFLNPNGIENGVFYAPGLGASFKDKVHVDSIAHLKATLPPGTVIKSVYVPAKVLGDPTLKFSKGKVSKDIDGSNFSTMTSTQFKESNATAPKVKKGQTAATSTDQLSIHGLVLPDYKKNPTTKTHTDPAVKAWQSKLTGVERDAIWAWKNGQNQEMRQRISSGNLNDQDKAFLSALAKGPNHVGVVYRGVKNKSSTQKYADQQLALIKAAGVGGTWKDTAPMCTSTNTGTAKNFALGVGPGLYMVVHSKSGKSVKHATTQHQGEEEVTTMPNVNYKILKIIDAHQKELKSSPHMHAEVHLEEI